MTLADALASTSPTPPSKEVLGKIADLLARNGIEVDDIGRVQKMNLWQMGYVNQDGDAEALDLVGVTLSPAWQEGPQWPVIQPGPAIRLPAAKPAARPATGWQTAVIIPDIQCGYYRNHGDELEPIHDERAIRIALDVTARVKPELVVLVGDNADFAEFGKYRLTPAFARTTQAAIDRLTVLCGELRRAAPDARIVWLAGNHEERLPNMILDNAASAYGLRRGQSFNEPPVMSVPFLCRFDEHGIEYLPGYPASSFWINDRLRVIHGHKVRSGGSTAHAYLASEKTSVIYGHVHRREYGARTREDRDGPKEIMAASPGCLARIDGVVPSTKGGVDLDGRPLPVVEDWQQGIALVRFEPGDGRFTYEQIAIHDGWALWNGKEYGG